jgi:hypothetical protein
MAFYHECHVTVEVTDDVTCLDYVATMARVKGFKLAEVKSAQRSSEGPAGIAYILTGHDKQRDHLIERMRVLATALKEAGIKIGRYKIEDISLDSRVEDQYGLLG